MDKALTLGKRLQLLEKIHFYKMMLYSKKGLCGWEVSHWKEKLKTAENIIKSREKK